MEISEIETLLMKINNKLNEFKKAAKIKGEHFNIFSVMKMETDEVYTHSAVIGELLNPKGSHGQGSVFLKLFIEEIDKLNEIANFDFDNAKVEIEYGIGPIDVPHYTTGGRIDIVIKDKKNVIVIENKIYAKDQKGQLVRYKNHYSKHKLDCFKLLYLTLQGSKPSKESMEVIKQYEIHTIDFKDVMLISYKKTILSWLEKCVGKIKELPILKEVISQYINLVKKITNQTMNNEIKKEVSELIQNNFLESLEINRNFYQAKRKIITGFWNDMKEIIERDFKINEENWEIEITKNLFEGDKFTYLLISKKDNKKASFYWRYTTIEIEDKDLPNIDVFFGIILKTKSNDKNTVELLRKRLNQNFAHILEDEYSSGTRSVIQKKHNRFTFMDDNFLAKIGKEKTKDLNTVRNGSNELEIFKEEIISFINDKNNKEFYETILEYLQESSN